MKIKVGYRLTVTSWENDADNYNTVVVDGLNEDECAERVRLCELLFQFPRGGATETYGNISNGRWDADGEYATFLAEAVKVFDFERISAEQGFEFEDEAKYDYISDLLYDLGLRSEFFSTRVVEKIEVCYIPTAIEAEDITDQFLSK